MQRDTTSFTLSARTGRTIGRASQNNWRDEHANPRFRDGWGLTAVDALSTAIVMRDNATVANILDIISKVDFSTTKKQNDRISIFETTIRYLGGMVACKLSPDK